jgi:hypothetical protein
MTLSQIWFRTLSGCEYLPPKSGRQTPGHVNPASQRGCGSQYCASSQRGELGPHLLGASKSGIPGLLARAGSKKAVDCAGGSGPGVNGASGLIAVHPACRDGAATGDVGVVAGADAGLDAPVFRAAAPVHCAGVGVYPPAPGGGHGPVTVTVDSGIVIVWPPGMAIVSAGMVSVCLSTICAVPAASGGGPAGAVGVGGGGWP